MSADAEFDEAVGKIRSAQHTAIQIAAGTWLALAGAAAKESGSLEGTMAEAAAQDGAGLLELADRLGSTRSFADGAASVARQIADQLLRAAQRSAQATERAEDLEDRIGAIRGEQATRAATGRDGRAAIQADQLAEADKRKLADEARGELNRLGTAFAEVIGGDAPAAPGGGAGFGEAPGAAAGAGGGGAAAADAGAAGAGAASYTAPNGAVVGAGEYPYARVLGPHSGDFAGWVQSPTTGFLVDPATGREFDPVAGRWIDPVTGQPFGEVTEYATRLSGLAAGPGAATPAGGTTGGGLTGGDALAGGAAAAGLAGLYGGVMPPSVGHTGPARPQLLRQAVANLGHRARVATGFAMREAAQAGGRPFTPPPAPANGARGTQAQRAGRVPPNTARARGAFPVGRGVPPTGVRPLGPGPMPPPAPGASRGAGASRAQGASRAPGAGAAAGASRVPGVSRAPGTTPGPASGANRAPGAGRGPASAGPAGRATPPAARGTTPPPAAGTTGSAQRGAAARPGGTGAPLTESRRTGPPRTPDAGAAARHGLSARPGATPPPPAGSATRARTSDNQENHPAPTELTENPDVWAPRADATRGVLGEQPAQPGREERTP
ncbi:hypothetical protein ACHZ98_34090 [Streptomyces sp. MAR4 CNY-716]